MEKKYYWEMMFTNVVLIFTTYTITKDLINENTVRAIIANSNTISALIYAGIVDIILIGILRMHLNRVMKQGRINAFNDI